MNNIMIIFSLEKEVFVKEVLCLFKLYSILNICGALVTKSDFCGKSVQLT